MAQGRRTFKLPLERIQEVAEGIFELKDFTYELVGTSAYAQSRDGKRRYTIRFTEVPGGTEVSLSMERKGSLRSIFRKRDPFSDDEEIDGIWKLFELMMPSEEEEALTSFINGLLRAIEEGREEIEIPPGFRVTAIGGGMLRIEDLQAGLAREVLLAGGTGQVSTEPGRLKVAR
ncbi:MAG: hypothetical protein GXO65_05330 [Euryarchaeota archaeon]|nr:hypothetical protein [Euryarchaeota archaeon]